MSRDQVQQQENAWYLQAGRLQRVGAVCSSNGMMMAWLLQTGRLLSAGVDCSSNN